MTMRRLLSILLLLPLLGCRFSPATSTPSSRDASRASSPTVPIPAQPPTSITIVPAPTRPLTTSPTAPGPTATATQGVTPVTPTPIQGAVVPAVYRPLYEHLERTLTAAEAAYPPPAQKSSTVWAAELITADANRGLDLLQPEAFNATVLYLDRLQALGVKGVKTSIQYPLLTPGFPNYLRYFAFFKRVAEEIRRRNMVYTVQASILFANTAFSDLKYDYRGLTFNQYLAEDRQMIGMIIRELQPDYLSIIGEPDTAAALTGLKEFNDPNRVVDLVRALLNNLDRGRTKIGAGTGSWSPPAFAEGLASKTSLDYIAIHIYPVNPAMLQAAEQMADAARRNGKQVLVTEAWLYKTIELPGGRIAANEQIFGRDVFSFWAPLDIQFMRLMSALAARWQAEFVSFFWSMYFFGYLDYAPGLYNAPYKQLRQQANQAVTANLKAGRASLTGAAYQQLIIGTVSSCCGKSP